MLSILTSTTLSQKSCLTFNSHKCLEIVQMDKAGWQAPWNLSISEWFLFHITGCNISGEWAKGTSPGIIALHPSVLQQAENALSGLLSLEMALPGGATFRWYHNGPWTGQHWLHLPGKWGFFSKTKQSSPRTAAFRCRFCKISFISVSKRNLKNMSKRHLKIWLFSGLFLDLETTPETLLTFFNFHFQTSWFPDLFCAAAFLSFSKEAVQINLSAPPALLLTPKKPLLSKKIHSSLLPSLRQWRHQDFLLHALIKVRDWGCPQSYSSSQLPLWGAWAPGTALLLPGAPCKALCGTGTPCTQGSQRCEHPSTAPAPQGEALTKHKQLRNSFRELPLPA